MKIHLQRIPETGFSSTEKVNPLPYALDTEEAKVVSPLEISYHIFLEEGRISVHFSICCRVELVCSRCLASYHSPLFKEMDVVHPIGKDRVIDVTNDIREEILLEYPMKPLCQETCKGICAVCGKNQNEGSCPHSTHEQ